MTVTHVVEKDELVAYLGSLGYHHVRRLPDGTIVGLNRLIYTHALYVGLDATSYRRRYCYENLVDAIGAVQEMTSGEDEPQGWIARRPEVA